MLSRRMAPTVIAALMTLALCSCAAKGTTRAARSASVTGSAVGSPMASGSQVSTSPVGDRDAVVRCQYAETSQQASFASAGANVPPLSVVAAYDTTVGGAQSYADSIGVDPSTGPKPVTTNASQDGVAVVVCILDGTIDGPGPGGPYTRELVELAPDGTMQSLVLANPSQLPLSRPSM